MRKARIYNSFIAILIGIVSGMAIYTECVALSPPSLRCISVLPNGNIELNWVVNNDTGSVFGGYHIYYSISASGPFIEADSVFNYNTTSYTHTSVNANNSSIYYYIQTREGCCTVYSASSDTLRSIRMIITPLSNEVVKLNWNHIHTPSLPTSSNSFDVEYDVPGPGFGTLVASVDTFLQDTNYFCDRFISYRAILDDASGCQSVSSIDGDLFRDTEGPDQPVIDTVSVDYSTGQATVSWFPSISPDTEGYVIYQFNGISYDSIGAVNGINSTFFQYLLSSADIMSETFSISAFDSCRNLSSLAENHNTMYLQGIFNKCESSIDLSWNHYNNMNGHNRYEIWYSENGGTWIRDGFIPTNINNYSLQLNTQGASYEILVRAIGGIGTSSSSNVITFTAELFEPPGFLYIRTATVTQNQDINVVVYADTAADVLSYRLYRSENPNSGFSQVGQKPFTTSPNFTFTDQNAIPESRSYYYRIAAVDSCGNETISDNTARTIHLTAENNGGPENILEWNDYIGWPSQTGFFNIYRVENGVIQTPQIANVMNGTLTYTDNSSGSGQLLSEYCYVIEAWEDEINSYGFVDSSLSNIACAFQEPYVFVPNAFTPGGKNPIFKPVVVFGDPTTYNLKVYNRWGQLVFESDNPAYGWNGIYENNECPAGVYVYQLIFRGYNQKEINRTGTLMLLK